MAPMIAVQDGRAVLAVGASGGRTIINNVAAVTVGCLLRNVDPVEAVAAPRLQCESIEPAVVERATGAERIAALRARGHTVREAGRDGGSVHLLARDEALWRGVAEPRLAGAATVVAD